MILRRNEIDIPVSYFCKYKEDVIYTLLLNCCVVYEIIFVRFGHLFHLQELDELQDHKLDQSADTGSESGSEDFLAAAILLRDQPPTLNQQGGCSTNNQLKYFFFLLDNTICSLPFQFS